MRRSAVKRLQQVFAAISFLALGGMALIVGRVFGLGPPWAQGPAAQSLVLGAFDKQVALVSGHAGYDSGAVCTGPDGGVLLTEAAINADVAEQTAELLRQAGADVVVLEEYDLRLEGLQAEALLSIHADSCIDASGYKAAAYTRSRVPEADRRLLDCIDRHYAAVTGLPLHPNTVTHNMTEYHAFRRIARATPAAILELGFMGGDQALLTTETPRVARGVADSLLCFLEVPPAEDQPAEEQPAEEQPAATPLPS